VARLQDFERELTIATDGLGPKEIAKQLAAFAIESRGEAIASGEASADYETFVNGRAGAAESQVEPPGPIVYVFHYGSDVAQFTLEWARAASPVQSGAYRDSWFILVEGAQVSAEAIPPGASFIVTNDQPYARKIAVGSMNLSVPPRIVERMRQAAMARYGNSYRFNIRMITLQGGYVLKGHRRGRRSTRKDTRAGAVMTYPALEISPK
jgi:hypothetical protein